MKNPTLLDPFGAQGDPLQFSFRVSAPIQATKYTWTVKNKSRPFPAVDIQADFLYYFYAFSFSADIAILDYQSSIIIDDISETGNVPNANTIPTFSLYLEGSGKSPILKQPLALPTYYQDVDFRKWRNPRTGSTTGSRSNSITQITGEQVNNLQGAFDAQLLQTPSLVGKESISMIMTLFAQEISSDQQQSVLYGGKLK